MSLEIGNRIGDYEVVSILGAGGMGQVYKVRNIISDRIEAMKILLPDLEHEPELADRFVREIKVQASLSHPNIAALHTALRVGNQLLMIMELVEGVTIEQRLHQGPIPLPDGVDYIWQVLAALGYAHQHGVIHRDIKPANMMLMPNGQVKLMDFGIAKAAADRKLTMTGTTMGSLYYMSPEQIKGMTNLDARADLYSVGVSLYEIVTGKKPFDGDSQYAIMAAHLEKTPAPPITLDTKLPGALNDVILMSIAREPEHRFQSAEAFRAALDSVRQSVGLPVAVAAAAPAAAARPPSPAATGSVSAPRPKGGRRGLWVAAGAVAMAVALIAIIQFGPWRRTRAQSGLEPIPMPPVSVPASSPAPEITSSPPTTTPPSPPEVSPPAVEQATPAQLATKPAAPPARGDRPTPVRQAAQAPAQTRSQPPTPRGGQQPSASPVPATPPAGNTPPQSAAQPAVDPAVLQELRERLVLLVSRAGAVRSSLQNMKRDLAGQGMSLRGDITASESRMGYMLDGANSALTARDAAAARKFIDSAETEVEKLEKFLGR